MSLYFRQTADPHGLDVLQDNKRVASLQWHRDRAPRVVIVDFASFTLVELIEMSARLTKESRSG